MEKNYEFVSTLGEGAYGSVWRCRELATGRIVAVKGVRQAHEDPLIMRLTVREVKILERLNHPNVVKMLTAFKSKSGRVYMVFEYGGRSLHQELERFPAGLPLAAAKKVAWQLLHGLTYLHDKQIVHRDIKPGNILLTQQGVAKLCDFGFARSTQCGPRDAARMSSYVVTRWYRAPEILVGDQYGPSADVWAFGCALAEIATGRPLFPGSSTPEQLHYIMRCLGPLTPQQLHVMLKDERLRGVTMPPRHKTLRQRLPEVDVRLFELLEACLQVDPARRPTARELLRLPYFWDVGLCDKPASAIPFTPAGCKDPAPLHGAAAAGWVAVKPVRVDATAAVQSAVSPVAAVATLPPPKQQLQQHEQLQQQSQPAREYVGSSVIETDTTAGAASTCVPNSRVLPNTATLPAASAEPPPADNTRLQAQAAAAEGAQESRRDVAPPLSLVPPLVKDPVQLAGSTACGPRATCGAAELAAALAATNAGGGAKLMTRFASTTAAAPAAQSAFAASVPLPAPICVPTSAEPPAVIRSSALDKVSFARVSSSAAFPASLLASHQRLGSIGLITDDAWSEVGTPMGAPPLRPEPGVVPPHVRPADATGARAARDAAVAAVAAAALLRVRSATLVVDTTNDVPALSCNSAAGGGHAPRLLHSGPWRAATTSSLLLPETEQAKRTCAAAHAMYSVTESCESAYAETAAAAAPHAPGHSVSLPRNLERKPRTGLLARSLRSTAVRLAALLGSSRAASTAEDDRSRHGAPRAQAQEEPGPQRSSQSWSSASKVGNRQRTTGAHDAVGARQRHLRNKMYGARPPPRSQFADFYVGGRRQHSGSQLSVCSSHAPAISGTGAADEPDRSGHGRAVISSGAICRAYSTACDALPSVAVGGPARSPAAPCSPGCGKDCCKLASALDTVCIGVGMSTSSSRASSAALRGDVPSRPASSVLLAMTPPLVAHIHCAAMQPGGVATVARAMTDAPGRAGLPLKSFSSDNTGTPVAGNTKGVASVLRAFKKAARKLRLGLARH